MKKITISKELCAEFNKFRAEHQNSVYSREEAIKVLRSFGFKGKNFLFTSVQLGVFIKVQRGKYQFCKEPVHISKLESFRKVNNRKVVKSKIASSQTTEEIAIDLLKSLNYRISKPQLLMEEAMKNPEKPVSEFIRYIQI